MPLQSGSGGTRDAAADAGPGMKSWILQYAERGSSSGGSDEEAPGGAEPGDMEPVRGSG